MVKTKVKMFWELIPIFVEVISEKLVGWGGFLEAPTPFMLKRVNITNLICGTLNMLV